MPIRPEMRARYPKDWPEISRRIRERARQRCEWSGCGVPNGTMILRLRSDPEDWVEEGRTPDYSGDWYPVRVVLTVAHKDHTPENCADDNLVALCQLHHLRLDAYEHRKNAAITRRAKREAAGQLVLIAERRQPQVFDALEVGHRPSRVFAEGLQRQQAEPHGAGEG